MKITVPSKAARTIPELLEPGPLPVKELVIRSGYSRKTIQSCLATFTSRGQLQRSKDGTASLYSLVPNGKEHIWNWTQPRVWRKDDGPIPGVFVAHKAGHFCEWSCDLVTPGGIRRAPRPTDPESIWWECRDLMARFGNLGIGAVDLVSALGKAPFPEDAKGAALAALQDIVGIGRQLYGERPYLSVECIRKTGKKSYPLTLQTPMKIFAGITFRPHFGPPPEVAKPLLRYANGGMDWKLLHDWEKADIAKMCAAFEEMQGVT